MTSGTRSRPASPGPFRPLPMPAPRRRSSWRTAVAAVDLTLVPSKSSSAAERPADAAPALRTQDGGGADAAVGQRLVPLPWPRLPSPRGAGTTADGAATSPRGGALSAPASGSSGGPDPELWPAPQTAMLGNESPLIGRMPAAPARRSMRRDGSGPLGDVPAGMPTVTEEEGGPGRPRCCEDGVGSRVRARGHARKAALPMPPAARPILPGPSPR
jgi:hypothetical protein